MSDRTNEEKLRILQERLAQIQEKKEINQQDKIDNNRHVAPVFEEDLVNKKEIDPILPTSREPRKKINGIKYFIIYCVVSLSAFGIYQFVDLESIFSLKSVNEEAEKNLNNEDLVYYKSEFNGNYIILLNSFENVFDANSEVKLLVNEGYNCNIFQLSGVSNSEEEIFQTYIGPFNKLEEANQYLNSSEMTKNSGKIITLK